MEPIKFGIIGGGWRTTFFLQIARQLSERFQVGGLLVRNAEKRQELEARWGIPAYRTLDELLSVPNLQFVVVCVSWPATPEFLKELAARNIPALAETPPAPDLEGLISLVPLIKAGAKIQVAEQYQFQPLHAARLALARSGKLGTITQAQISIAHGYHGMSLMRKFLDTRFDSVTITAQSFTAPLVAGISFDGQLPAEEKIEPSRQVIAYLDFHGKLGIFDFTYDQYFSWVRSPRMNVVRSTTHRYVTSRTSVRQSLLISSGKMPGKTVIWKVTISKGSREAMNGSTRIHLYLVDSAMTKLQLPPAWTIWHVMSQAAHHSMIWQRRRRIITLA
jgi:predicted dehydrogenase